MVRDRQDGGVGRQEGGRSPTKPAAWARRPGAPLLTLRDVHAGDGGSEVLTGIDMTLCESEVVVLLGRNGVGKTTTLGTIAGLVRCRGQHDPDDRLGRTRAAGRGAGQFCPGRRG